jgi:hypothetical protein
MGENEALKPLTLWAMFHRENEDEPEGSLEPLPSLEIHPGVSSVYQGFVSFVLHRKKYDKVPFVGNIISIFNSKYWISYSVSIVFISILGCMICYKFREKSRALL